MKEKCEFLERCGFFLHFSGSSETVKNGWVNLFCEDLTKSEFCKRKIYKREHGQPPADNMTPTGIFIGQKKGN